MLTLRAIAPKDGYAVFEEEGKFFMLRPPFRQEELVEVEPVAIEQAIGDYGFEESKTPFETLPLLIQHLKEQITETNPVPTQKGVVEAAKKIVKTADQDAIKRFLTRLRSEMNLRQYYLAHKVLVVLLENVSVKANPSLLEQVTMMLNECCEGMQPRNVTLSPKSKTSEKLESMFDSHDFVGLSAS